MGASLLESQRPVTVQLSWGTRSSSLPPSLFPLLLGELSECFRNLAHRLLRAQGLSRHIHSAAPPTHYIPETAAMLRS